MPADKIISIHLIGVAEQFAKNSDLQLLLMRGELTRMVDDLLEGRAILASDTTEEDVLALSLILMNEMGMRGLGQ